MKVERDRIIMEGQIIDFSNGLFKVKVSENHIVVCRLSGKIRQSNIKVLLNDQVRIEVSEYDTSKGRIIFRMKGNKNDEV